MTPPTLLEPEKELSCSSIRLKDGKSPSDPSYWTSRADDLKSKLENSLPSFPHKDAFQQSIQAQLDARRAQEEAQKLRDFISKQNPVNQDELTQADMVVTQAKASSESTLKTMESMASIVLNSCGGLSFFLSPSFEDSDLLTYTAITTATAKKLASWCAQGPEETDQLLYLFDTKIMNDPSSSLLHQFFLGGGPRLGEYGRAMQIWFDLHNLLVKQQGGGDPDDGDDNLFLQRLALSIALELCCELDSHPMNKGVVDPLARYQHYHTAYLNGELDPAFTTFTVWEMRMAVNSDATDEELQWGRDCLKNYRPDLVLLEDPHWQYIFIVRTDVDYKQPEWYKPHPSYDQILSGGGECGPRAWYGRFICKAFGIPTWGVRQPGHAAVSRWTSQGWMTALGAGFDFSDWDGRCGDDFLLETKARHNLGDCSYLQQVLRLEFLAQFRGESDHSIRTSCASDPSNLWFSLSLVLRMMVADSIDPPPPSPPTVLMETQLPVEELRRYELVEASTLISDDDGTIVIPASSGTVDKENKGKVVVMKSFSGGDQLFLGKDGEIEYTIKGAFKSSYNLILSVCTVHRTQEPLLVTISTANNDLPETVLQLTLPYTVGMWQETQPIAVAIDANTTITVHRQEPKFGVAVKYIKLIPTSE